MIELIIILAATFLIGLILSECIDKYIRHSIDRKIEIAYQRRDAIEIIEQKNKKDFFCFTYFCVIGISGFIFLITIIGLGVLFVRRVWNIVNN